MVDSSTDPKSSTPRREASATGREAPTPWNVRLLGIAALLLIAVAVRTNSIDWAQGLESRITGNTLEVFVESASGIRHNSNPMAEHSPIDAIRFELILTDPRHVMLARVYPDRRIEMLWPESQRTTRHYEPGRHVLALKIPFAERNAESFVACIISETQRDLSEIERVIAALETPLTFKQLWHTQMPHSSHWVHLPTLDADGRAIQN